MKRKHLLVLIAAVFIGSLLGGSLYYSLVLAQSAGDYDPWSDLNDDGTIDMRDIGAIARKFGSSGDPFQTKAGLVFDSGWINFSGEVGEYYTISCNFSFNIEDVVVDARGQAQEWNQVYGRTGRDSARSVVQTADGGYVIAGSTNSSGAGLYDYWLVKTDATGNEQWNKTYGGTGYESAWSVVQTADGGYAIAGYTDSFGAGLDDFWLVKTDATGNEEWNKTYGGTTDEWALSMVQTADGGYAIAGSTSSFSVGYKDFWLIKTDATGNEQWNKTYGETTTDDHAFSVVQTADGGYATAGAFIGPGFAYGYLVKTDSAGNTQWNKTYGGTDFEYAFANSVVQTADGGYAIAGSTDSFGAGLDDAWLVKTDATGNEQWNKTYGGTGYDYATALVQTTEGGYALAGYTNSFGAGLDDAWLVKTNATGNEEWNKTYGGTGYESVYSMVQTADGEYALAGSTDSFGAGSSDFYLVKTGAFEAGLAWAFSTPNIITLHTGATWADWSFVRVRIWQIKE